GKPFRFRQAAGNRCFKHGLPPQECGSSILMAMLAQLDDCPSRSRPVYQRNYGDALPDYSGVAEISVAAAVTESG
ncbi:MAG: hypothetical protein OEN02_16470, partial [Gammaproteobacteria bacterium]|nr:hypothetical protein [Gammaproteobacteria bacterium]